MYTLRDLFLKIFDITSFETHRECDVHTLKFFIGFCYGALNFDSLISTKD